MCPFIETIRITDGKARMIFHHNERMNRTRRQLLNCTDYIELENHLFIPPNCFKGIYKCRITYREKIENIEFEPYMMRKIETLKLIVNDEIEYNHKYADRTELMKLVSQRENCDDILIVKNDCITDTSYANIVFSRFGEWFTPSIPLLPGTRRECLISNNIIQPINIRPSDLELFDEARIINAMIPLEESPSIKIENIRWGCK